MSTLDSKVAEGMSFARKWAGRFLTIMSLVFVTVGVLKALAFNAEAAAISSSLSMQDAFIASLACAGVRWLACKNG
jgi:hypothetical protein